MSNRSGTSETPRDGPGAASFRGRPFWITAGISTVLLAAVTRVFDAGLLDYQVQQPGFWAWTGEEAICVLIWVIVAALLGNRVRLLVRGRWPGALLLGVLLAACWGLGRLAPRGAPIDWAASGRRQGHDLDTYVVSAGDLVRRVVACVPASNRIAVVHDLPSLHRPETYTPEVPLFLFYLTTPRLLFFYEASLPDREELHRLDIRWILDLRGASYRTGYRTARLRAVDR